MERCLDIIVFVFGVRNVIDEFVGRLVLDARIIRQSQSLIWRKPRQFHNNVLAELTIGHFADSISEVVLKYFASMERRHGEDKPVVSPSVHLFTRLSDTSLQMEIRRGELVKDAIIQDPGLDIIGRVQATQLELNSEIRLMTEKIVDLSHTIHIKTTQINELQDQLRETKAEAMVSLNVIIEDFSRLKVGQRYKDLYLKASMPRA